MVTLHAFLALLAGCATMVVLDAGMAALTSRLIPGWAAAQGRVSAGYAIARVGWTFQAGAAGGYVTAGIVTARMADGRALGFVLMLALVALTIAGLSAVGSRGKQPVAFQLAMAAVTPIGVMAGGLMRLKMMGVF